MPEQLPQKGHGPTLQRKTLAMQGCGRAVKFCLRPALNPRLGSENNCLLSSDVSRTQEWKQHGGCRHSCFALETPPPVRFFVPDPEEGVCFICSFFLSVIGIYANPNRSLCNSEEEITEEHLQTCKALPVGSIIKKYWSARAVMASLPNAKH